MVINMWKRQVSNMENDLKRALNILQIHLVSETVSDNVLYIFDNKMQLREYRNRLIKQHQNTPDKILITIDDLLNGLTGLRFKSYLFITDEVFI